MLGLALCIIFFFSFFSLLHSVFLLMAKCARFKCMCSHSTLIKWGFFAEARYELGKGSWFPEEFICALMNASGVSRDLSTHMRVRLRHHQMLCGYRLCVCTRLIIVRMRVVYGLYALPTKSLYSGWGDQVYMKQLTLDFILSCKLKTAIAYNVYCYRQRPPKNEIYIINLNISHAHIHIRGDCHHRLPPFTSFGSRAFHTMRLVWTRLPATNHQGMPQWWSVE